MITKKILKTADYMRIYADGHAVIVHKKRDRDAGEVKFVTLHETIGARVSIDPRNQLRSWEWSNPEMSGCLLVYHTASIHLCSLAQSIVVRAPSVKGGSPRTQEKGLQVGSVELNIGHGPVYIPIFENLLSGDFEYMNQSEQWETVKDSHSLGLMRVAEIFRRPSEKVAA